MFYGFTELKYKRVRRNKIEIMTSLVVTFRKALHLTLLGNEFLTISICGISRKTRELKKVFGLLFEILQLSTRMYSFMFVSKSTNKINL